MFYETLFREHETYGCWPCLRKWQTMEENRAYRIKRQNHFKKVPEKCRYHTDGCDTDGSDETD